MLVANINYVTVPTLGGVCVQNHIHKLFGRWGVSLAARSASVAAANFQNHKLMCAFNETFCLALTLNFLFASRMCMCVCVSVWLLWPWIFQIHKILWKCIFIYAYVCVEYATAKGTCTNCAWIRTYIHIYACIWVLAAFSVSGKLWNIGCKRVLKCGNNQIAVFGVNNFDFYDKLFKFLSWKLPQQINQKALKSKFNLHEGDFYR